MRQEYRSELIAAEQKSQNDYDKTLVSLSGGALAISLLFIKNIIGKSEPILVWAVITAWSMWAASLTSVVFSFFLSRMALRKAIIQTDQDDYSGGVGGWATPATQIFNALSGILFILGIIFLIVFASNNIGDKVVSDNKGSMEQKGFVPPPPPPHKTPIKSEKPVKGEGGTPPPPSLPKDS